MENNENSSVQYGIDLGTTYSCIARINPGTNLPEVIKDQDADSETLASAVFFDNEKNEIYIGDDAKEAGASDPKRLCEFFKRYIGRSDLAEADKDKIDGPYYMFEGIDGKTYSPVELSSKVLARLVDYAKKTGAEDVKNVVITCPAYFDNGQREATRRAGEAIGLNVINVVNEPTAAAVDYYHDKLDEDQNIMVYDLGGGTFDVTIVHIGKVNGVPTVDVIGTDGDDRLGGKDWDARLYKIVKTKFENECEVSIDDKSDVAFELRRKIEKAKIDLSKAKGEAKVVSDDGEKIIITRNEFEKATVDLVELTLKLVDRVLGESKVPPEKLDRILLVGGSTKMPMIQAAIENKFGADKVILHEPSVAVAKGAAIIAKENYAGNLAETVNKGNFTIVQDEENEIVVIDPQTGKKDEEKTSEVKEQIAAGVLSVSIKKDSNGVNAIQLVGAKGSGIQLKDVVARTFGLVVQEADNVFIADNVIFKGDKAPANVQREYYTLNDNQTRLGIPVVESTSKNKKDIVNLANEAGAMIVTCDDYTINMKQRNILWLDLPDNLRAGSPVSVDFSIDNFGNINISVEEKTSKKINSIKFNFTDEE